MVDVNKTIVALILFTLLLSATPLQGSVTIEFSVVTVRVSPQLYGSPMALPLPFNTSWYPSESSVYVLSESSPSYYHVFSIMPPLLLVFEPSMSPERTYRVFASTSNPYASFSLPYSHGVFAAYDDFDVDTGMWVKTGSVRIAGGSASLSPGSAVTLNASMTTLLGVLVSVRGGRGLRIELPSAGPAFIALTDSNFTDWSSIRDGGDIYFISEKGEPQYYSIIYLNKDSRVLVAYVVATNPVVFMAYGGVNPYSSYRLG